MGTFRKVRAGRWYVYRPVGLDRFAPAGDIIEPGMLVKVIKRPGCPPPNTMGHAYVAADNGHVALVCTNSLVPWR